MVAAPPQEPKKVWVKTNTALGATLGATVGLGLNLKRTGHNMLQQSEVIEKVTREVKQAVSAGADFSSVASNIEKSIGKQGIAAATELFEATKHKADLFSKVNQSTNVLEEAQKAVKALDAAGDKVNKAAGIKVSTFIDKPVGKAAVIAAAAAAVGFAAYKISKHKQHKREAAYEEQKMSHVERLEAQRAQTGLGPKQVGG